MCLYIYICARACVYICTTCKNSSLLLIMWERKFIHPLRSVSIKKYKIVVEWKSTYKNVCRCPYKLQTQVVDHDDSIYLFIYFIFIPSGCTWCLARIQYNSTCNEAKLMVCDVMLMLIRISEFVWCESILWVLPPHH